MLGTIVNVVAIIVGSVIGLLFGASFSKSIRSMVMQAIALSVMLIGIKMAVASEQLIIVLLSLVFGAWTGELLNIEGGLERIGKRIEDSIGKAGQGSNVAQAFATASLLYCVGAMAIMGALESGLTGSHSTLYAKSVIDGITSIMLTTTLGIGVIFSAIPVFIYQGLITVTASWMQDFLTESIIIELKAVGGLIILAIGLNILNITKVKVGNLLPAIIFVVLFMILAGKYLVFL
ncbi:MAG: DUF554 domain-containing protein [Bacillota bacterium]